MAARQPAGWQLELCTQVIITVHPDLESFRGATGLPWYVLATADRAECSLDTQRLRIVAEHGGIERTLRHELFHLAQPDHWPRWLSEGRAQRFAGERPRHAPLEFVSPDELDRLLAAAPDQATLLRALATALSWVMEGRD